MDERQLRARFEHHPPEHAQVVQAHEAVRERFADLAVWVDRLLPDGREKSQALTALDDGCMYANAAIARTQLLQHDSAGPVLRDVTGLL